MIRGNRNLKYYRNFLTPPILRGIIISRDKALEIKSTCILRKMYSSSGGGLVLLMAFTIMKEEEIMGSGSPFACS